MKKALSIGCVLVVVAIIVGGVMWNSFIDRPMYEPGMVRNGNNLRAPLTPPKQDDDDSYWRVESDVRLYYETHGQGRPVIVVHGGPGFPYARPWAGLERLAANYKFYYYHQRGCGKSTKPFDRFESKNYYANMTELEQTLGIGAQVADLERIRQILKQDKLLIIGHSFGGFLASMYAAEFPKRVEALVLVAPAGVLVMPDPEGDLFARMRERLPAADRPEYDRIREEMFDFGTIFSKSEAELAAVNRQSGGYLLKALGEKRENSADANQPDNGGWMPQALYFSMGRKHDYRLALSGVRAPVLVIHGENDDLLLSGSRSYQQCFPNAEMQIIAGGNGDSRAGHFVFDDQPEPFAKLVGEFLDKSQ